MFAVRPFSCTGMMALLRRVILRATLAASSRWSAPQSASTGVAPTWWMAAAEATKVWEGTMTSSPAPTPAARNPIISATVPSATPMTCLTPRYLARFASN